MVPGSAPRDKSGSGRRPAPCVGEADLRRSIEALGVIGLPSAILDGRGRIVAINTLMEDVAGLVWRGDDRLAFNDVLATRWLHAEFASAGALASSGATQRVFLARMGEGSPVVVHVFPLRGAAYSAWGQGLALLTLTSVSGARSPDLSIMRQLFDLTAAEARVAAAISEGLDTDGIALRHGVSRATARTHIRHVLAKTGTRRRAEAAALFAAIPRLPLAPMALRPLGEGFRPHPFGR